MYFRAAKKSAGDISLSDTIERDGDGGALCIMDVVCSEDDMLEQVDRSEMSLCVRELVEKLLEPREKRIIMLRYGLNGQQPKTQHEVAEMCGISRSYVSRIEKKALEKLRCGLEK